MKLEDFLDLGFKVDSSTKMTVDKKLTKNDEVYQNTYKFALNNPNFNDIQEYLKKLMCELKGMTTTNGALTALDILQPEPKGEVVILDYDWFRLRLEINSETHEVYNVDDCHCYFRSLSNMCRVYESNEEDDIKVKDIIKIIYDKRLENKKEIKKYYEKEIRDIRKKLNTQLEACDSGIKRVEKLLGE